MISILTATRRPDEYENMVNKIESSDLGELVDDYIAFVNDSTKTQQFRDIKQKNSKIKVLFAPDNFIFRNGFDTVYNSLIKASKSKYCLMVFDADNITVDIERFKELLNKDADLYSFKMYMQRGDVWETKHQLFKSTGVLEWFGLVHENQRFTKQPVAIDIPQDVFCIEHLNAIDKDSQDIKKTDDGFIILEKAEEGSDSDIRNMLYESLTWKIVNANGRHFNKPWFEKHYQINKDVIDYYYEKAKIAWG